MDQQAGWLKRHFGAGADRTEKTRPPKSVPKIVFDDQTGKPFEIDPEGIWATIVAGISAIYLICMLALLLALLFDTWSERYTPFVWAGYSTAKFATGSFRLMAFVTIGGALGGTVDGLRSIISWHCENRAYGPRFIWKDIALPMIGAAVGLITYLTVRSGVGIFNGDFSLNQTGGVALMTAFTVAWLAGFSSLQVFRWLDDQANKLFNVAKVSQTIVPDLSNLTAEQATAALKERKLTLGKTNGDPKKAAKVQSQSPAPGTTVPLSDPVDITFAAGTETHGAEHPAVPETLDEIAVYLEAVFEEGDPALVARALAAVARARGMNWPLRREPL